MSESKTMDIGNQDLVYQGEDIIRHHVIYSAGVGFIPFPIIDLAALLGIQVSMIKKLGYLYDKNDDFRKNKVRRWIQILIADLGTFGVLSGVKAIPVFGPLVGMVGAPVYGAASTYALGKVFLMHFDNGGSFLDFDPHESRLQFKKEYKEASKKAKEGTLTDNSSSDVSKEMKAPSAKGKSSNISGTAKPAKSKPKKVTKSASTKKITKTSKSKSTSISTKDKKQNDLKIIEGIGPKIEGLLNDAGINNLSELSKTKVSALNAILEKAGPRYRLADPATWPDQAKLGAKGKWDELKDYQDKLDGGVDR